ncbi:MAG: family 20 glycosylhydrolase [Roseburia sp.]|nr:family 20 glycosylhydrolase [Roseburia sp.]MCM1241292.1 family 20 glycosylhydrolase [Roseburia sp.]
MAGGLLLLAVLAVILTRYHKGDEKSANLALKKGVKATCDSMETEALSADKAIDGDDETLSSRWSSENNWEDASHYIELEFPEEISVSFVVLKWERTNVTSYRLEGSLDGENWQELASFGQAPMMKRQEIPLTESVSVRFLRLSTEAVSQTEEDYSNLYQNVSLYEFEVYADKPAAYLLEAPTVGIRENNIRYLILPKAPEGYQVTFAGADYEQVIGADGEIYDTIQDKEVTVGLRVEPAGGAGAAQTAENIEEVSFTITVPAADGRKAAESDATDPQEQNTVPQVIPAIAEWRGREGFFMAGTDSRIVVGQEGLRRSAELFAGWYREIMGYELPVISGTVEDVQAGDFFFTYADAEEGAVRGLGEEGYVCDITDTCVITGTHEQGIYWGTITVLQILKRQEGVLPQGTIRDYPKYPVRGFGIDVARKPVSMAMLYQIMETMSWYKMNDLCIHLNDNVILSTSGLTESVESAMSAESAFRLQSDIMNEKGEMLTAQDYAYTAQEFALFIDTAKDYGIQVVPEIDTPAHSLSITKLFPEYALQVRSEAVDQIDLGKKDAVELVKEIWEEAFASALAGAEVVNIGMDEYYGDGETYRQYMNEIIDWVKETGGVETVRLWGSLSNMDGITTPAADGLQMNLWSTIWADPMEMYEQGYSLINMQNNHLYIIPGGGYDYLDTQELTRNWEVNKFYDYNQLEIIPSYSSQMLGASYMIWNDMSGSLDVGISETGLFERFMEPLGVISYKLWGEYPQQRPYEELQALFNELGTAPGTNPYAVAEWEGDSLCYFMEEEETALEENVLTLQGGADYRETGYRGGNGNGYGIGGTYTVSMQVYKKSGSGPENNSINGNNNVTEEILFETDGAYGQTAFKAVQTGTGQVGFSREGRDYSFDYYLPEEEWVTLTVHGEKDSTSLYVNGELVDTLGNGEAFEEYAAFVFPLERIGSKTNAFCGMIKEIEISQSDEQNN